MYQNISGERKGKGGMEEGDICVVKNTTIIITMIRKEIS